MTEIQKLFITVKDLKEIIKNCSEDTCIVFAEYTDADNIGNEMLDVFADSIELINLDDEECIRISSYINVNGN